MDGNRLIETPYDLSFRKEHEHTVLCKRTFTAKEVLQLRKVGCAICCSLRASWRGAETFWSLQTICLAFYSLPAAPCLA